MRLGELLTLYLVAGLGSAAAWLLLRQGAGRALDALVLVPFWPLYGPFLLVSVGAVRASAGPASLAPGELAVALERRVAEAEARIREIDRLLGAPGLSEAATLARAEALEREGAHAAARAARARLEHLARLGALRGQMAAQVAEVRELLLQAKLQAEVLRLAGGDADPGDLLLELRVRLETLDAVLAAPEALAPPNKAGYP